MVYFDKIGLDPDYTQGKTQRVYCSVRGAAEPVSQMKFHVYYDTRLTIKENAEGEVMNKGKAVTDFTTGSAMVEEGQLSFYAYSDHDIALNNGSLFTIDFIVPEDAEPGDVYPIGIVYTDDGIVYDTFINSARDKAGKLQMTYLFTKGIYNGYIKMMGEKKMPVSTTTTTETSSAAEDEPLAGDVNCDKEITVADAVLLCRVLSEDTSLDAVALQWDTMDMDSDGILTVSDVMCILKMIDPPAPPQTEPQAPPSDDGWGGYGRPDWGDDDTPDDGIVWGY